MSEQYFSGIRKGDRIWTIQEGWTEVVNIGEGVDYPLQTISNLYTMDGKYKYNDARQSAFWSDPGIVAPPRPKRMKKVKVEVRPYVYAGKFFAAPATLSHYGHWCGPIQFIEVEVGDD